MIELKLDPHQQEAFEKSQSKDGFLLFMKQGTGKTLTALAMIHRWRTEDRARKVLIIGPLSAIDVWEKELKAHYSGSYRISKLEFSKKRRKLTKIPKANSGVLHIVTINYSGIEKLQGKLRRWKPDVVVCDECQSIKNRRSKQSRAARRIGDVARFRIGCSGTPMDGNPIHLWAQFRFIEPAVFGNAWADFEKIFVRRTGYGYTKYVMRKKKLKLFRKRIEPHIYECDKSVLKLPPVHYIKCFVALSSSARELYNTLERDAIAQIAEEAQVVTPIVLTKLLRLRQVTGGFLPDEEGKLHAVDYSAAKKLARLLHRHQDEKIVVFCAFIAELLMAERLAQAMGRRTVMLRGHMKVHEKLEARQQFQNAKDPIILNAQIRTGGIGINELKVSRVCIFYSTTYSWIDWDQALSRLHRRGQDREVLVYSILATDTIDVANYETIRQKGSMEDLILRIGGKSKWRK